MDRNEFKPMFSFVYPDSRFETIQSVVQVLFNLDLSKIFNFINRSVSCARLLKIYIFDKKERLRVKDESINFIWFILLRIYDTKKNEFECEIFYDYFVIDKIQYDLYDIDVHFSEPTILYRCRNRVIHRDILEALRMAWLSVRRL